MITPAICVAILVLVTLALMVAPLWPALTEWKRPDHRPLHIPRDDTTSVDFFAQGFRAKLARDFADFAADRPPQTATVVRPDHSEAGLASPDAIADTPQMLRERYAQIDRRGLSAISHPAAQLPTLIGTVAELRRGEQWLGEIYTRDSFLAEGENTLRALLCDGHVRLGPDCSLVRWLDAATVQVGPDCALGGRVSADVIDIDPPCRFIRMSAGVLRIGGGAQLSAIPDPVELFDPRESSRIMSERGPYLYTKPLEISSGRRVDADLIVAGQTSVGPHCTIQGSIKSHGHLKIGDGCRIDGNLFAKGDIQLGEGCQIDGCISSSGTVTLANGCHIGREGARVSVVAPNIRILGRLTLHGSIWATNKGEVIPA